MAISARPVIACEPRARPADGLRHALEEGAEPIHLGFIVPDLLATFRRCRAWGAPILAGDVASRDPLPEGALPRTSFKVADPNGNVIDVMGDPHHWLGVRL
jgi:catechol 2,3-dioxygenase-like lactoylglutathione lyase family enzyme